MQVEDLETSLFILYIFFFLYRRKNQFEGGWKTVNDTLMTGPAVTAMYMPSRPDIEKNIKERGAPQGRKGNTNSWPIDILTKGDLYEADAFGKIGGDPIMGATLANSIYSKSNNGVVLHGAIRDLPEIKKIKGFNAFVRDFHPSFTEETVLMGLNTPIRIGNAIVLPGDLVVATKKGVLFIPAHMAEQVVSTAEFATTNLVFKWCATVSTVPAKLIAKGTMK